MGVILIIFLCIFLLCVLYLQCMIFEIKGRQEGYNAKSISLCSKQEALKKG